MHGFCKNMADMRKAVFYWFKPCDWLHPQNWDVFLSIISLKINGNAIPKPSSMEKNLWLFHNLDQIGIFNIIKVLKLQRTWWNKLMYLSLEHIR